MYTYEGSIVNVVDGDTYDIEIDCGFSIFVKHRFRLSGIDTPETWRPKSEAERKHGEQALKFVEDITKGQLVTVTTYKLGIYGRYEADIAVNGQDLGTLLREAGLIKLDDYTIPAILDPIVLNPILKDKDII